MSFIHLLFYIRVYYYACDSWDGNHDVFDDGDGYDDDDNIYICNGGDIYL